MVLDPVTGMSATGVKVSHPNYISNHFFRRVNINSGNSFSFSFVSLD